MNRHQKEMVNRLEAMSIEQARREIASGSFGDIGSPNHAFASSWLSVKEATLRDAREAKTASLARKLLLDREKQKEAPSDIATIIPSAADTWHKIEKEYGVSKRSFGKKINFVKDQFKRKVVFRDIEQAFVLAHHGFNKPSVILAGGVIEELLRLYLAHRNIIPAKNSLDSYIKACDEDGLLKTAIHRLADSVRQFRNIVHLERESSSRYTLSKATAKGAVSSIFTIVNDFEIGT